MSPNSPPRPGIHPGTCETWDLDSFGLWGLWGRIANTLDVEALVTLVDGVVGGDGFGLGLWTLDFFCQNKLN